MALYCLVSYPGQEHTPEVCDVKKLPELLKTHQSGLFRGTYMFEEADADKASAAAASGTLPLAGPMVISHSVRQAVDLLLDGCEYEGIFIQLEVSGKRLPELPARAEIENYLKDPSTLVVVDGRLFKPSTEVFGFQQVYDDTVKVIDNLKKLGIPQETMMIFATPAEISIEIHHGVFGLGKNPSTSDLYRKFLFQLGDIKVGDGRCRKSSNRTLLLETPSFDSWVLVPGSNHPTLHRPRVGIGASHFAYGTAAFSDYCGKKRSANECLKELQTWVRAIETGIPPVASIVELFKRLAQEPAIDGGIKTRRKGTGGGAAGKGFRSLKSEVGELVSSYLGASILPSPWKDLNKSLGGGWRNHGVYIITGPREEGKAGFLLNQALAADAAGKGVLYLSKEHSATEFILRATAVKNRVRNTDLRQMAAAAREGSDKGFAASAGKFNDSIGEGFFFRGTDAGLDLMNLDEILQLVSMIPSDKGHLLVIESLTDNEVLSNPEFPRTLRDAAKNNDLTILTSVHSSFPVPQRPHLIEGSDTEILGLYQGWSDAIVAIMTERLNHKRFLASTQGKVDPAMVTKLEAHFASLAGPARFKTDSYSLLRVVHTRDGQRNMHLFMNQREIGRFLEGPSAPISRA